MSDYTPIHKPGQTITSTTSAAVTGGQVLEVTGNNTVGPAAAGSLAVLGQAAHDAAAGSPVTVHALGRPVCVATAAAAVTAGQRLKAAAGGQVTPYVDGTDAVTLVIGLALAGAASGAAVRYQAR